VILFYICHGCEFVFLFLCKGNNDYATGKLAPESNVDSSHDGVFSSLDDLGPKAAFSGMLFGFINYFCLHCFLFLHFW
jgi:hypothetical protein